MTFSWLLFFFPSLSAQMEILKNQNQTFQQSSDSKKKQSQAKLDKYF